MITPVGRVAPVRFQKKKEEFVPPEKKREESSSKERKRKKGNPYQPYPSFISKVSATSERANPERAIEQYLYAENRTSTFEETV